MNTTAISQTPLDDLRSQFQCFALPYGAISFIVHLIADYVILADREFDFPGHNIIVSTLGMLGGASIASYNAYLCRNSWPLVLISVWKVAFAVFMNVASICANWGIWTMSSDTNRRVINVMMVYSFLGIGVGAPGLGVLIREGWADHRMRISMFLSPLFARMCDELMKYSYRIYHCHFHSNDVSYVFPHRTWC